MQRENRWVGLDVSFTETNHFIDSPERKLFWNFVQKEQQIYESSRQWLDCLQQLKVETKELKKAILVHYQSTPQSFSPISNAHCTIK